VAPGDSNGQHKAVGRLNENEMRELVRRGAVREKRSESSLGGMGDRVIFELS